MSLTDVIFGPAKLLAIAITFFVGIYIWISFSGIVSTGLLTNLDLGNQAILNDSMSNISIGLNSFDYMMPFIVVGMLTVSLIFAFKTGANIIYAVLSIILWVFALLMTSIFTNTYLQVDAAMNLGSTYGIINLIMLNLKWIVLGWLALLTVVIFSRNKAESGGSGFSASEQVFG